MSGVNARATICWLDYLCASLTFGILLGLSASPVLGVAITGALGIVATYFKPIGTNEKSPPWPSYLTTAMCIFLLIGASLGMLARNYDILGRAAVVGEPVKPVPERPKQKEPPKQSVENLSQTKLFSGFGDDWFSDFRSNLAQVSDDRNSSKYIQADHDISLMQSFVEDLKKRLDGSAQLSPADRELVLLYDLWLTALKANSDTLNPIKKRRDDASAIEEQIFTKLKQLKQPQSR